MTVNATEAVSSGLFAQPAAATTTSSNALGKDDFLQLLVTQLRYQDPSNPTDTTQMMAQTAQFSALEAMQKMAGVTQQLLTAQNAFGASTLVGRSITYTGADGKEASGAVKGVTFGTSGPQLQVGEAQVPIANVLSITA